MAFLLGIVNYVCQDCAVQGARWYDHVCFLLVLRLSMFCSFICVYVLVPIHIYWLETKCLLNHINIYFFCMSVDTKLFSNRMKSLVPGF